MEKTCKGCANVDTDYCIICVKGDMYQTEEEKAETAFFMRLNVWILKGS